MLLSFYRKIFLYILLSIHTLVQINAIWEMLTILIRAYTVAKGNTLTHATERFKERIQETSHMNKVHK